MIRGLLKSFFLHLFIVGLFIYGAEIFKNNKKFEINEIPLDIVDISEQTITKTEKKNQEKATKKNKQKSAASNSIARRHIVESTKIWEKHCKAHKEARPKLAIFAVSKSAY